MSIDLQEYGEFVGETREAISNLKASVANLGVRIGGLEKQLVGYSRNNPNGWRARGKQAGWIGLVLAAVEAIIHWGI